MSKASAQARKSLAYHDHKRRIAADAVRGPGVLWPTPHTMPWSEALETATQARLEWLDANPGRRAPWLPAE